MDFPPFTDDEVVNFCQQNLTHHLQTLSDKSSGRKIIELTANVVVKFGLGVTIQEASAQQLAFQHVSCEVLRIPRVYRFFSRLDSKSSSTGYLVMEKIEGVTLEQVNWEKLGFLPRIVTGLNTINSILDDKPGPVSGGEAHGSLWSEYGSGTMFYDLKALELYLNERLAHFQTSIRLRKETLCLCHMDAAPRNFMLDQQGRLCLIDWATAGFYPRYFELWSIEFAQHVMGNSFGLNLLQDLRATPAEVLGVQKLSLVYRFNSHYASNHSSDNTDVLMAAVVDAARCTSMILS